MAAADDGRPGPDHYRLLGVAHGASREEIARAWRRRARAEHPDSQPGQAGDEAGDQAANRFRALAEAYHVLSDPGRRAAYDRVLGRGQVAPRMSQAVPVPVRRAGPGGVTGPPPVPEPPLRAGPVRMDGPRGMPAGGQDEDEVRVAVLVALALRCLARERDWSWRDREWQW
jgi:curved DNA-binding protein CbpA